MASKRRSPARTPADAGGLFGWIGGKSPAGGGEREIGPLERARKNMEAENARLEEQAARLKKVIEDAPRLKKERARLQREMYKDRAARVEQRRGSPTALPDRRYELNAGAPARHRRLRAERNRGRMMFFVLLAVAAAVATWFYLSMFSS